MRRRHLTLTLVLAGALVAGAAALAQGPRGATPNASARAGMAVQRGFGAVLTGGAHADLAALLGISEEALAAERVSGKTVADILVEHGVTTAEASSTLIASRDARIDAALADGTLDARQAAAMKSRSETVVAALLTRQPGVRSGPAWNGDVPAWGGATGAGARAGVAGQGMGLRPHGMRQGDLGRRGTADRTAGYGGGHGPGTGIHDPGTGFQPGYRFAPPRQ